MWDHTIDLRKGFVPRKENLSLVQRRERRSKRVCPRTNEKGIYLTIKVITDHTSVLCWKERWEEKDDTRLLVS